MIVLAGFAVVSIAAESRLSGQPASASLTVTANVSKNCTITTAPVNFGAYDPVAANATAPLDGIGTVTVTCTKGAAAKVGLSAGSNAQGATRRMRQGATAYPDLRTLQGQRRVPPSGAIPPTPASISLRRRTETRATSRSTDAWLPAQDATVGNYTDTVVATVNF